jgi:thiol-disulfide isomerase/thioredoxin
MKQLGSRLCSLVTFLILFSDCNSLKKTKITEMYPITGYHALADLKSSKSYDWLNNASGNYQSRDSVIHKLRVLVKENEGITFLSFVATWCTDTHLLLPQFETLLEQLQLSEGVTQYYFLDLNKKSPEGLEQKYKIEYVPTFIVLQNGKELGRIVEKINRPIEEEVLSILVAGIGSGR